MGTSLACAHTRKLAPLAEQAQYLALPRVELTVFVVRALLWVGFIVFLANLTVPAPPPSTSATLRTTPPPVPRPDRRWAGTTLTYYGERPGFGMAFERALLRQFEQDTGIRVNYIPRPLSASECYASYQRVFQARSPDVDVMMVDVVWPGALAPHLVPLSLSTEGFLPQLVENSMVDGKLVAMPGYLGAGLLYYRTDLLQSYGYEGPPRSFDELEQMAKSIQAGEKPVNPRFVGFVWQGYTYEGLTCNALEWQVSQGGGQMLDQVDSPEALRAFSRAAGWIGTISPAGVTGYQEEDVRNVFEGGNAAFMRHWPYCYASGNAPGSPVKGRFEVAPLPGASVLGGWEWAVSAYSRHPQAAEQLVAYQTCLPVQRWRAVEGAFLPTRPELYKDPELLERMPFCAIMPEVFRQAITRPSTRCRDLYNEASSIYFQGVATVLQGGDPAASMGRVRRDLSELMQP